MPNITGYIALGRAAANSTGGAFYNTGEGINGSGDWDTDRKVNFDASRSNSIYGKSNTVTPENYSVNYFIKYY